MCIRDRWLLSPLLGAAFAGGLIMDPERVLDGQVWRLITYALIMGGTRGFLWTALAIFFFGPPVEERLGTRRMLTLYAGSLVAAAVLLTVMHVAGLPVGVLVAAEAASLALVAAFARTSPNARVLFSFIIPVKAIHILWLAVALEVMNMWDVQRIVWPAVAVVLGGVGVGWVLGSHAVSLADFNPVERFRNWRYRQRMQKFTVVKGGKKSDPSQYLH